MANLTEAKATLLAAIISAISAIIVALITTYLFTPQKVFNLFSQNIPVGTIVASMADYNSLLKKSGIEGKWVPADGRLLEDAYNTEYYKITGNTSVPDLQGVFIRGLNKFENNERTGNLIDPDKDINGKERIAGSFQLDTIKKHKHILSNIVFDSGSNYGLTVAGGNTYGFSWPGYKNTPTQETGYQKEGKEETRPKNIALYYYIKIN